MRHQNWLVRLTPIVCIICFSNGLALTAQPSDGADGRDSSGRMGFEIGNGRKPVKNSAGRYSFKVSNNWEAGYTDKFTEVLSPLYEGSPRTRIRVDVVEPRDVSSTDNNGREIPSVPVIVSGMEGRKRVRNLGNGIQEIEVVIPRSSKEALVISIEGKTGKKTFDKVKNIEALEIQSN